MIEDQRRDFTVLHDSLPSELYEQSQHRHSVDLGLVRPGLGRIYRYTEWEPWTGTGTGTFFVPVSSLEMNPPSLLPSLPPSLPLSLSLSAFFHLVSVTAFSPLALFMHF